MIPPTDGIVGRSIQIDPGFAYYQHRSPESVALELEVNGYKIIRFIVTNDDDVDDKLIDAFHKRGMFVWYETFGNGFYGGPTGLPKGWEDWKMGVMNVVGDPGYTWMSLSCPQYREWKNARIADTVKRHKFDGIEVVEPFQMGWSGPKIGNYGDVSKWAFDAFAKYSGYAEPPEFKDAKSPRYFETDKVRYGKWVDFRVREVCNFVQGIGETVRKYAPGKPFAIWALANSSPDPKTNPAELAREWQGIDAVAMAKAAKPDQVCFQTNWPDWSNPTLPGSYPELYKPLTEPLQKALPKLPFIVQADIGSNEDARRSREWSAEFEAACRKIGASGSTAYSYNIGLWMYTEPPLVKKVDRVGDEVRLVFQKRLETASANVAAHYTISPSLPVSAARVDGNLVYLRVPGIKHGVTYTLTIKGVKDDPTMWNFTGKPANTAHQTLKFSLS